MWAGTSWRPGAASRLWAHHALHSMSNDLALRYGDAARVVYAPGPAAAALRSLCSAVGAARVVANRRHEPAMVAADAATEAALLAADVQVPRPRPCIAEPCWAFGPALMEYILLHPIFSI